MKPILNLCCGNETYGTHRVDKYETNTTTHELDINKTPLPFENEYFEEVYMRSGLEHLKNVGFVIGEIRRVLKKGGKVWIRTDFAGFLPAHLFKKHEPNEALEVQYDRKAFGHLGQDDHHYYLFCESHLKYLFGKFHNHKFKYVYGGSNTFKNIIYKALPKHMGACHIEMECIK